MRSVAEDVEKLQANFDRAREIQLQFMNGKPINKDVLQTSLSTLSAYSRLRGTEGHHKALEHRMVKDFSVDKAELRKIMGDSVPEFKKYADKKA